MQKILVSLFSVSVVAAWLYEHLSTKQEEWMVIGTPLIILGIVIGGVYAWSRYFHGMRSVSVKIAPIAGIAAILVLTLYL